MHSDYTLLTMITASGGGDPHFSVLLTDGKLLCYSVQGESNSAFNLISSSDFVVNAKFIPDSKREEVTWMGSIGVVLHKALQFRTSKVTHIQFNAKSHTIYIGIEVPHNVNEVREIISKNGNISIVERDPKFTPLHPAVKVHLKDVGLYFTVKFYGEHLDLKWHHVVKDSNSHGLIGEAAMYVCQIIIITCIDFLYLYINYVDIHFVHI